MMLVAKQVADLVTYSRLGLAGLLVWLGLTQGAAAMPLACWLMVAAWTADSLDGPLARRSRVRYQSWIGDHDLWVDMAVSAGLLLYMAASGYVDLPAAAIYLLAWTLAFWRWGVPKALGELFQAPIYAWFIVLAIRHEPQAGLWLVGWILAAIVITWPKFPKETVPEFLADAREAWRRYQSPDDAG